MALQVDFELVDVDGRAEFASYYAAHFRWLLALVARAIPNRADVEDVCAEVFEVAFAKRAFVGDYTIGQQRKWLYEAASKAMMRRARGWARNQQALVRAFHESSRQGGDPLVHVIDGEASQARAHRDGEVRDVVKLLRREYRHVLELSAAGLKGPAIAERLGIGNQLARTRLMFARREFSELWIARNGPDPIGPQTP